MTRGTDAKISEPLMRGRVLLAVLPPLSLGPPKGCTWSMLLPNSEMIVRFTRSVNLPSGSKTARNPLGLSNCFSDEGSPMTSEPDEM